MKNTVKEIIIKDAIELRVGDWIICPRMTVVEIKEMELSGYVPVNHESNRFVIVTTEPMPVGLCFREDEKVAVLEI